jgi:hypothetical protein
MALTAGASPAEGVRRPAPPAVRTRRAHPVCHGGRLALDLADWRFPGLRTVCFGFYTAPQRPGTLEQLRQRGGPRLTRVKVNRYNPWWDAVALPPFHPHNRCLGCPNEVPVRLASDTLACLARTAGLCRLSARAHIQRGTVEVCLAQLAHRAGRPCCTLQQLAVEAADAAMPGIVELVAHAPLTHLYLRQSCDTGPPFFALLARLPHVCELTIMRDDWSLVAEREFAQLGLLSSSLLYLTLDTWLHNAEDLIMSLTDKAMRAIAAGLPELEILEM